MIELKATQDKVLAVLQSIQSIVERRHTLPSLDKVIIHKAITNPTTAKPIVRSAHPVAALMAARNRDLSAVPRSIGFFSASKANLRNAP